MNRSHAALIIVGLMAAVGLAAGQQAAAPASPAMPGAGANWTTYLGDPGRTHYSTLAQIDKGNVAQLQVAWTYDTGDRGEYQANNLMIDGVLFTASPTRKVIALNAATGSEIWKFDPSSERPGAGGARQRGLAYWANESGGEARLFTGSGNYLYALDAKTGTPIRTFADKGALHLGTGTELDGGPKMNITLNTPGVIYKDLYIVGGLTDQPGGIRAYDVRSGAVRWIFHTIPRPGEYGYDTWPAAGPGKSGGVSNWCGAALDAARGIVYVPTESATPDFWGGDRHGANLFANSLIALDAATGRRLWHYQLVHHDLLDKDPPTPPVLLTVTQNGRRIDAVAQGTKHGLLFVFDRVTGVPLWPIEERPVPQTTLPGEQTWPTQPFPLKPAPLMRQRYTAADASTISPTAHAATSLKFSVGGSFGAFPAPSLKETIIFPGFDGGMEWGGAAADPDGTYYVNVNEIPWLYQMVPTRRPDGTPLPSGERSYLIQCASCHGIDQRGDPANGFPPVLDLASRRTHAQVMELLDKGGARMPAFAELPESERRAVVDYLFGIAPTAAAPGGRGRGADPAPYAFTGFRRWQVEGYPAISPPWGTLNAVNLNTGEIKWKVPLGEYPELTAKGIPPTGTENYGGPVVTATGLIFIGATADETIRAFDKETGRILWQARLPFGGNATPSIYMVDGKQYVVISAGGTKSRRPSGGSIVAFALPK